MGGPFFIKNQFRKMNSILYSAKQKSNQYLTDPTNDGDDGNNGSTWDWGEFWTAFGQASDTAANTWGNNNRDTYPYPQVMPQNNNVLTYGLIGLFLLVALVLVLKLLK